MSDHDEVMAWARAHLDALGAEAVRRYLLDECFGPVHREMPGPEVIVSRAYQGGQAWDALDLAVVAHRVVSGIAWRWIGARYVLARVDLAPDLEDRRRDGKKVTGKPYAVPAREAITRLARAPGVIGNQLAPSNRHNVRFADLAAEWRVPADLLGATLGPGAAPWIDPSKLTTIGRRDGENYYRVIAEGAEWVRGDS